MSWFMVAVLALTLTVGDANAKSSSSSSRSSSSSSSRSSSSSSSNSSSSGWGSWGSSSSSSSPSSSSKSTISKSSSGWGSQGSSSSSSSPSTSTASNKNTQDSAAKAKSTSIAKNQSQKAAAEYQSSKSSPASAVSAGTASASGKTVTNTSSRGNNDYRSTWSPASKKYNYSKREHKDHSQRFYSSHSNWRAPVYVHRFEPSYGMWDTIALWYMLDHIQDQQYANMYYSHRNESDMQKWRQQAEVEAQSNAKLRAELDALDKRVKEMEKQGIKEDHEYVPAEMADVAFSDNAFDDDNVSVTSNQKYQKPLVSQKSGDGMKWFLILLGSGVLFGAGCYFIFVRKY